MQNKSNWKTLLCTAEHAITQHTEHDQSGLWSGAPDVSAVICQHQSTTPALQHCTLCYVWALFDLGLRVGQIKNDELFHGNKREPFFLKMFLKEEKEITMLQKI